ncbi:MAG: FtsQ-type POTRA domain-containing protein [Deltaproteobacteria bacterium]|jgi:cell division septal protein FtsQ|nr:FtsQ-type POTRA domain-containing protein [Deltaproteobacteria bacterium]
MNMPLYANIKIKSVKNLKGPKNGSGLRYKLFLKTVAAILLLLGLGLGAKLTYNRLCHCDFFQITAVKIQGNRMTSKEQVSALSRVDIHTNLLAVNVNQVESLLESHPWIARAEVVRDWPNRLLIILQEKNPVALLNRETGLFYLDNRGGIIAAVNPSQELDFPVITGLEKFQFNSVTSENIPEPLQDVYALLKLANRNNPILPEQNISEIHLAENGELVLYLLDKPFPIYMGSDGKISTRYKSLVKVLKDLYKTQEFSEVSYIRLDYKKDTILVGKLESDRINQG